MVDCGGDGNSITEWHYLIAMHTSVITTRELKAVIKLALTDPNAII